ncbi:MAG: hypothetical protein HQL73_10380 [Magnetococcales bacterium]|nr:hypothetical protein [Magnetococcales bacterium]
MKIIFPISLAGRTLLILSVGLTFSHLLSILVFTSEKLEATVVTSEGQVLERMAAVARLLLELPDSQHQPVLVAMNRSGMHFSVEQMTAQESPPIVSDNDESLRRQLEHLIAEPRARVVAVRMTEPDWNHQQGSLHRLLYAVEVAIIRLMHDTVMDQELQAWVDLPAGHRLFLSTHPADNHVPLFRHATISVSIMTGAILFFSLIITRHLTIPFARIVRAADTFGQDVYAVPLPEEGAVEIVSMARAFNRMNRRIREFVEDRLRMIAAISHDLRTPLTKLKLLAEFVGDETTRARLVATMDEMEAMLTATLSLARDATTMEPKQRVNLSSLLLSICENLRDIGHTVSFLETDKQPCLCRPLAMKRAMTNLIHNALKYGGSARVFLDRKGEWLSVVIRDPGPGIPEEQWDNVFKPFLRLEPSRSPDTGGVGLGLTIAASVIRDHDGTIIFAHPPEGGFEVRVQLPEVTKKN